MPRSSSVFLRETAGLGVGVEGRPLSLLMEWKASLWDHETGGSYPVFSSKWQSHGIKLAVVEPQTGTLSYYGQSTVCGALS